MKLEKRITNLKYYNQCIPKLLFISFFKASNIDKYHLLDNL